MYSKVKIFKCPRFQQGTRISACKSRKRTLCCKKFFRFYFFERIKYSGGNAQYILLNMKSLRPVLFQKGTSFLRNFEFIPFRRQVLSLPPATNANRWAFIAVKDLRYLRHVNQKDNLTTYPFDQSKTIPKTGKSSLIFY